MVRTSEFGGYQAVLGEVLSHQTIKISLKLIYSKIYKGVLSNEPLSGNVVPGPDLGLDDFYPMCLERCHHRGPVRQGGDIRWRGQRAAVQRDMAVQSARRRAGRIHIEFSRRFSLHQALEPRCGGGGLGRGRQG